MWHSTRPGLPEVLPLTDIENHYSHRPGHHPAPDGKTWKLLSPRNGRTLELPADRNRWPRRLNAAWRGIRRTVWHPADAASMLAHGWTESDLLEELLDAGFELTDQPT